MSHTVELTDEVYAAVQKEADSLGTSPEGAIASKFLTNGDAGAAKPPVSGRTLRDRLGDAVGSVRGRPGTESDAQRASEIFSEDLLRKHESRQ
jgi:hypothetical protein